jgi:hypothetical protein
MSIRRCAAVHVLTVVFGACVLVSGQTLRPSLADAASQPILTFATALAAAGQPAGFIVPADVLRANKGTVPTRVDAKDDLAAVVKGFEAFYPAYTANVVSGSLHVRPRKLPSELERLLAVRFVNVQLVRVPAMMAVLELGRRLAGKKEGGGVVGTGPPPDGCPLSAPITYRDGRPTPVELLDAISRQVRGLVWLVSFTENPDGKLALSLGLVCPNDRLYNFEVDRQ